MLTLSFWNSKSGRKETFDPIDTTNVRMYVCGPTVYGRAHIGNARSGVVFDVLYRCLRHVYGQSHVTYVRNITDIDDKINARALELKKDGDQRSLVEIIRHLTDRTIAYYHEDMSALGVASPNHEPRATCYVPEMIGMIEELISRGHAYESQGHVLFDVTSYSDYGALSRRSLDEMIAGSRVEVAPYKSNDLDFVLWKPSSDELPGWESPWGRGRPGWHIECSVMSRSLLGESFDIHGGGSDLAFPHHENEAAQSFCACPEGQFARTWMHNGMVRIRGQKMAKSLGNFITVKQLTDKGIPGEVIRFVLLGTHYRQKLDWTASKVSQARNTLQKWYRLLSGHTDCDKRTDAEFLESLSDDLNTPGAVSILHKMASTGDITGLRNCAQLIGLLEGDPNEIMPPQLDPAHAKLVDSLVESRDRARSEGDFDYADKIRGALEEAGIQVRDSTGKSSWQARADFNSTKFKSLLQLAVGLNLEQTTAN